MQNTRKQRLLTGDRPTGSLHLGHYVGSIKNRVSLQDEYECFFLIADLHTLTTRNSKEDIKQIEENTKGILLDYLACGIDPDKSTIYLQSEIKAVYQLNLFFSSLVSVSRLSRIPSLKEMAKSAFLKKSKIEILEMLLDEQDSAFSEEVNKIIKRLPHEAKLDISNIFIEAQSLSSEDSFEDLILTPISKMITNIKYSNEKEHLNNLYNLFKSDGGFKRLKRFIDNINQMGSVMPYSLLGYPVLQAADILVFNADIVPVGKDNESHIEIAREIARKFNHQYKKDFFAIPKPLLGSENTLCGINSTQVKMSKSLNNHILLKDDSKTLRKKINMMYTDPNRIRPDIPGNVEGNVVFAFHDVFNADKSQVEDMKTRYREGKIKDVEIKDALFEVLENFLFPIRERRLEFAGVDFKKILKEGTKKAIAESEGTLEAVKDAMGFNWF